MKVVVGALVWGGLNNAGSFILAQRKGEKELKIIDDSFKTILEILYVKINEIAQFFLMV
jgi:hypothetical protein